MFTSIGFFYSIENDLLLRSKKIEYPLSDSSFFILLTLKKQYINYVRFI